MKILQVHNSYLDAGGEDRVVRVEADALRDAGDEVIVARTANPDRFASSPRILRSRPGTQNRRVG